MSDSPYFSLEPGLPGRFNTGNDPEEMMFGDSIEFDLANRLDEPELIDVEELENNLSNDFERSTRNGRKWAGNRPNPIGIAARSEINSTLDSYFDDDLELITGRKKFLVYGEYAGGFAKFNREVELDKNDEVDLAVKERISAGAWDDKVNGKGWGPGFGNIGKGSENLDSSIVKFQKYKMTKSMVMYLQGDNRQFGKYVGYGCWCLAGGDMELGQPGGEPVDDIDRACRQDCSLT